MEKNTVIKCPHCKADIDVNNVLYEKVEAELKSNYNSLVIELKKKEESVMQKEQKISTEIESQVTKTLQSGKAAMEQKIRQSISEEKTLEIQSYQEQLKDKGEQLRAMNKLKADLERISREKDNLRSELSAENEISITKAINQERSKLLKEIDSKNEFRIAEKELLISQLRQQLKNAHRKVEEVSSQVQGEVQEQALEDLLKQMFPGDEIIEVRKGMKGADVIHNVINAVGIKCGSIYIESKRCKDFKLTWIKKFKEDMRGKNASFGVIVTDTFPSTMTQLGQIDGIWICSFQEFRGLALLLREAVILLNNLRETQHNKAGKMELLYQYLMGNEFRLQVEAVVEGMNEMITDLNREKRAMELAWKQREKQIEKVTMSTSGMYGAIKGIAGSTFKDIEALTMPINTRKSIKK